MIGRAVTTIGSLSGYTYAENDEKMSYGEKYNLTGKTHQEQWNELRMIASLNDAIPRKKYVNALISFDKSQKPEKLTNHQIKDMAETFAKELGFYDNQWKFAVHTNTDELHIHFYANRIGFDTKNKVKAHNIGKRSGQIVDAIAIKYGLKTSKEIGKERRNKALNELNSSIDESKTWDELKQKMQKKGYHFILNKNIKGLNGARIVPIEYYKSNDQLSEREKTTQKGYKLSQLSRKLKIQDIAIQLERNRKLMYNFKR